MKYYDSGVFRGKKCVVTDCVEPIKPLLSKFNKELILFGLHNIADALAFIHNKCQLSVNNVTLESIFLSRNESTDCWKLGSLFCCSSAQSENIDFTKKLSNYHNYFGTTNSLAPEDLISNDIQLIKSANEIHRRDAFAFGLLLNQLLSDVKLSEQLQSLKSDCISKRPNMKSVLNDELFLSSDFVQIKSFLTNFASFNENDKKLFFNTLVERLRKLSNNLIINLISFIVSSRLIMSNPDVHNKLLPFILIPAYNESEEMLYELTSGESITLRPLLNKNIFKMQIIPLICKMYCVRDLQIRLLLLQYLPNYAKLISKGCFRQFILPQILLGIKDSNDELVSLTFKAMSHLVNIFGSSLVLGQRVKLFSSGIPKINQLNDGLGVEPIVNNINSESVMLQTISPDGRENVTKVMVRNDFDGWDDWEQDSSNNEVINENINKTMSDSLQTQTMNISNNSKNNDLSTSITPKANTIRNNTIRNDLDIKELDFKLENNEIDILFSDMEPVFKFGKHSVIPEEIKELENIVSNSNIFAANEGNIEEIGCGWTDQSWDNDWDKDQN